MDEKLTSARRGRFGGFSLKTCFSASAFGDSLRFASLCVCGMGVLDEWAFVVVVVVVVVAEFHVLVDMEVD